MLDPLIITVAPNGARKTKKDHPALPITPEELAVEAFNCMNAGAAMIHLHVRDQHDGHILDVGRYREAIIAIKETCGDDMIVQATTEAVGMYSAEQQMALIRELKPQAASFAIKELVPLGQEQGAKEFFLETAVLDILPHYIVYSAEELQRFHELVDDGIIPKKNAFLLFVLGRYSADQISRPVDLLPFLNMLKPGFAWSICAFGALEHAAASAAIAMGGHVRVGFENNLYLKNRTVAPNNADLVRQVTDVAKAVGRSIAKANEVRFLLK